MFDHREAIAGRDSRASKVAGLDVGRRNRQDVAIPQAGGEPHEGVGRIFRRMGPAIHPDRPFLLICPHVHADGNELLRVAVMFLPDPKLIGAEKHIRQRVGRTLVLEHRMARSIPAIAKQSCSFIDRYTAEVSGFLTGNTIGLVFVVTARPLAHEVHLPKDGRRHQAAQRPRDHDATMNPILKSPHVST
jgi:hypothetical protein